MILIPFTIFAGGKHYYPTTTPPVIPPPSTTTAPSAPTVSAPTITPTHSSSKLGGHRHCDVPGTPTCEEWVKPPVTPTSTPMPIIHDYKG